MEEADYLIIGAGPAGCILADRLSRDGRYQVLVVEAGPADRHPYIHIPKGMGRLAANGRYNWAYPAEAEGDFPGETWPRGRTLGGSSATNGFIYNRGRPEDYDALEAAGCTGWNWSSIAPMFEALEDHALGAGPNRGVGGPLHVTMPRAGNKLYDALLAAGGGMRLARVEDLNAPLRFADGAIGLLPRTIHKGRRWSAARAFLDPAAKRANVRIWTGTHVDRLLFNGRRASGAALSGQHNGQVTVRREIIVAAGTIASPALLQRSGIGQADKLLEFGINPVANLPSVGFNMSEHRNAYFQFRMRSPDFSQNRDHRGMRLWGSALRYAATQSGLLADGACEVGAFARCAVSSDRIDTQILFMPISMGPVAPGSSRIEVDEAPGITVIAYPLRPLSRGFVSITSADPACPPRIVPHYLQADQDQEVAIAATRFVRRMMTRTSLARYVESEIGPMADAESDSAVINAWLRFGGPGCHAVGTCRMGSDTDAVVDPRLRVIGVDGLRIVDASVFPFILAGNTAAPVMACAMRASDLIAQDAQSQFAA